jgi:FkbM family methyltransferase
MKRSNDAQSEILGILARAFEYPPFFVQIGANDGVTFDPVYSFIKRRHWRGIRIEPIPRLFEKLKALHKNDKNIILENVAITKKPGIRKIYSIDLVPGLPDWACGTISLKKDVMLKHEEAIPNIRSLLKTEKVRCVTLSQVLAKHDVSRVDFIFIDTDGCDFEIIKSIDLPKLKPLVIFYENLHLGPRKRECAAYLEAHDYHLIDIGMDTVAAHRSLFEEFAKTA